MHLLMGTSPVVSKAAITNSRTQIDPQLAQSWSKQTSMLT